MNVITINVIFIIIITIIIIIIKTFVINYYYLYFQNPKFAAHGLFVLNSKVSGEVL